MLDTVPLIATITHRIRTMKLHNTLPSHGAEKSYEK